MIRFCTALVLFLSVLVAACAPSGARDLSEAFAQRYGVTLDILAQEFPRQYAELAERLEGLAQSRLDETEQLTGAFVALTDIRKTYAHWLGFANDDDLKRILIYLARFYDKVAETSGAAICGRFAVDGAGVLFDENLSLDYAEDLDAQSAAYFYAVIGAINDARVPGKATQQDWETVTATMIASGATPEDINRIAASDPADPGLCSALVRFVGTIALIEGPAGERVRADFAASTTGY